MHKLLENSKDLISLVLKEPISRQCNRVGKHFDFTSVTVTSYEANRPTFPIIALNALQNLGFASSNLHLNLGPDIKNTPRYLHAVTHSIESSTSDDNFIQNSFAD